jgi:hypothetical protein
MEVPTIDTVNPLIEPPELADVRALEPPDRTLPVIEAPAAEPVSPGEVGADPPHATAAPRINTGKSRDGRFMTDT